jgi:hypothetical protein
MNDLDTPTHERIAKAYTTLQALAAIAGYELIKSDPEICGQAPYYLYRHGTVLPFESVDALNAFIGRKGAA